eukprot:1137901-Pelagomonas_calceolata.AAC.2
MACDKRLNHSTAAGVALKPCIAGTYRVKTFANNHNLTNRLHAFIWILKTFAIPAGMYASQMWATPYLRLGTEMDNPLHRWILNVLRNLLGVKTTTPSWRILPECGIEPSHFNWFRELCVSTIRSLRATVSSSRRSSTQTSALAPGLTLVRHHTSCLRWMVWHTRT